MAEYNKCFAEGCGEPVRPPRAFCRKHWDALPKRIRNAIWESHLKRKPDESVEYGTCIRRASCLESLGRQAEMDRGYNLFFEMLSPTFNAAEQGGVTMQDAFPALVDFAVALSIVVSGGGAEAMIDRIRRRAPQWKDGCFPLRTATLQ